VGKLDDATLKCEGIFLECVELSKIGSIIDYQAAHSPVISPFTFSIQLIYNHRDPQASFAQHVLDFMRQ